MIDYDVAVIGAGPSGVMAAWKAALSGCRTILLEKEKAPGKKACAEGVLANALDAAEIPASKEFVANQIDGAVLYPPEEDRRVNVKGDGYILDKPKFLSVLADRAERAGASLSYGSSVEKTGRMNGGVVVSGKNADGSFSVGSKVVIGCDGVFSPLAKQYFGRGNYQVVVALQYTMSNCHVEEESKLHIYVGHEKAPSGYVWIFPKGDGVVNVGLGMKGPNAKQLLDKFVHDHPLIFSDAKVDQYLGAPVPVGGQVPECVADNMILCGDAAGQVIPLTGAGIHTGLVSGRIAGEVAAKCVGEGDVSASRLSGYKSEFNHAFGERIMTSLKALESFEKFSDDDLNVISGLLEGQDLIDLVDGYSPKKSIGLMMKHPLLAMKVAYQLLSG